MNKNMAKQLIDIDIPETTTSTKSSIPIIPVDGDAVRRFNEASDNAKAAVAVMTELRAELVSKGLEYIFNNNVTHAASPDAQIQSVRLQNVDVEDPDNTETLTVTWSKKALKTVKDKVTAWFATARTKAGKAANINDYAEWEVAAKFDTSIFDDPKTGKFDTLRYQKVLKALDAVTKELKAEKNPLSCGKALKPTEAFFAKRWTDFDLDQNLALVEVLPTQVNLEPVRTNGDAKG